MTAIYHVNTPIKVVNSDAKIDNPVHVTKQGR